MKAIETQYKGYRFRSRLEARWAVFFDAMGFEWQYEPQGYEKTDEQGTIRYLPDFRIRARHKGPWTWVEVKGDMTEEAAERLERLLLYPCPLPGFDKSTEPKSARRSALLLLGEVPEGIDGVTLHKVARSMPSGLVSLGWVRFSSRSTGLPVGGYFGMDLATLLATPLLNGRPATKRQESYILCPNGFGAGSDFAPDYLHFRSNEPALPYNKARSARFEHGEMAA